VHVWIDSSAVSRRHARLRPDGNRVVVEDPYGTWVNGAQVTGVVDGRDGDEIRFGTVTARLRAFRDTQSTQTAGPR
jgi:pSer/pThr/pTyr-binding forkhead associated (FHA) protein